VSSVVTSTYDILTLLKEKAVIEKQFPASPCKIKKRADASASALVILLYQL